MFQLYVCSRSSKRIIIVSSRYLICYIIAICWDLIFFALSNRKPILITKTMKQIGSYLNALRW